ncbi:MAG: Rrf2 family transcriptional regulator [bacterium]|nr:Rrf2 family transcriptional regulator [Candidatus Colisoma equi]
MHAMKEKASARTKYATRILLDLGLFSDAEHPRTFAEIAQSQKISPLFVSTIAVLLKRAGFIKTMRGPNGGITLARDPINIHLLEVIEAVRGPLAVMPCLEKPKSGCKSLAACPVYNMWSDINSRIRDVLNDYTLGDVIARIKADSKEKKIRTPRCP